MKPISIKLDRELVPITIVLVLFLLTIPLNYLLSLKMERKYNHLLEVKVEKLNTLHLMADEVSDRERYLLNMILVSDKSSLDSFQAKIRESRAKSDKLLESIEILFSETDQKAALVPLQKSYRSYGAMTEPLVDLASQNEDAEAIEFNKTRVLSAYESIQTNLSGLSDITRSRSSQFAKDAIADIAFVRKLILAVGLLPVGVWLAIMLSVLGLIGWSKLTSLRPRKEGDETFPPDKLW